MLIEFKDIPVNKFFIAFGEPYMKTTNGSGFNDKPNAFNFLMGEPVEFDPAWEVAKVTYGYIVKQFFPAIMTRVTDG